MSDLSYEIAELRALSETIVHLESDDLSKSASPYLIRLLLDRATSLERKYEGLMYPHPKASQRITS